MLNLDPLHFENYWPRLIQQHWAIAIIITASSLLWLQWWTLYIIVGAALGHFFLWSLAQSARQQGRSIRLWQALQGSLLRWLLLATLITFVAAANPLKILVVFLGFLSYKGILLGDALASLWRTQLKSALKPKTTEVRSTRQWPKVSERFYKQPLT